jgi:DNA-directed RNA polymerase subunit omega
MVVNMAKNNYDGMRDPSVDLLLEKIDSKYKLAFAAARRAKIIVEEDWTSVENPTCVKPIGQALEEILEDKTKMTFKKL